jgi:hypothetical protein
MSGDEGIREGLDAASRLEEADRERVRAQAKPPATPKASPEPIRMLDSDPGERRRGVKARRCSTPCAVPASVTATNGTPAVRWQVRSERGGPHAARPAELAATVAAARAKQRQAEVAHQQAVGEVNRLKDAGLQAYADDDQPRAVKASKERARLEGAMREIEERVEGAKLAVVAAENERARYASGTPAGCSPSLSRTRSPPRSPCRTPSNAWARSPAVDSGSGGSRGVVAARRDTRPATRLASWTGRSCRRTGKYFSGTGRQRGAKGGSDARCRSRSVT